MKDIIKIIRYSWNLKKLYMITVVLVVITSLLNQVTPFLLAGLVNAIVKHNAGGTIALTFVFGLLLLILVVNLAVALIQNIQGYYGDILGAKLNSLLSQRYYNHILKLPLAYYDNEIAGRITSRLERSITTISQLMSAFANNFIGVFLTSAITLVILAYYAWPVAILLAVLFPFYIWLTTLSSRAWQKLQQPINHDTDVNNGRFVESVNQIRVVKSFVQEVAESRFFAGKRHAIEEQTKIQSRGWHRFDFYRRVGLGVVFFGIYTYIILETFHGRYNLGQLTLLLQLVTQAQMPLFASSFIIDAVQRAKAGSKDFFDVMEQEPSIVDAPNARELKVSAGEVIFKNVQFAYGDGQNVLNGINFTIRPGTRLALVGESGEGKTTISNLLLRFYELSGGEITVDGINIQGVTQVSLRRQIGVVFQEPALFSGTVGDNISYGTPKATTAQIESAAKAANALTFIKKLPKGLETEIGERGVKLSGGQRQRIAIARAILKDPPILILDEATSSLDSKAEHEVQLALNELMKDRTTLIIAHRLSTIASVDTIVGIRGGKVIENGSPSELAHGSGIYAELLELQKPTAKNKAKLKQYDIAR
jgi:ATP-binding cassette subfamily B protein